MWNYKTSLESRKIAIRIFSFLLLISFSIHMSRSGRGRFNFEISMIDDPISCKPRRGFSCHENLKEDKNTKKIEKIKHTAFRSKIFEYHCLNCSKLLRWCSWVCSEFEAFLIETFLFVYCNKHSIVERLLFSVDKEKIDKKLFLFVWKNSETIRIVISKKRVKT